VHHNKTWIYEFDYIRTIAIIAVIVAHGYGVFGGASLLSSFQSFMGLLGAIGVILFFFISGFLISKIEPESLKFVIIHFKDRILRIGPLFWIALFLTASLFSLNVYQGFWIKNFDIYNVLINSAFLINFTPYYDIPPFWFVSALVLFNFTYLILRYFFKNPFYFAVSSLGVYFLFLTLEMAGRIWATNAFIYFIAGALLGMLYNANLFTMDKIKSVHPVISTISDSSYSIYLFHLIIFSAIANLFASFHLTNFYICLGIALIITVCVCILIQKGYDWIMTCTSKRVSKKD
jgi:peptidoglycan/LPS O-acetylase OafA/YrhL